MRQALKRWLKRLFVTAFLVALALTLFLAFLSWTGMDERWARTAVIHRIEQMTGARVELGAFHFHLAHIRVELDDLTLHGKETEDLPPFVHVDRVRASIRIISFLEKKISLEDLEIDRPSVAVRIDENGATNVPAPAVHKQSRPWREQLFDLAIQKLRVNDGSILFNNARTPLAVEGNNFRFALDFDAVTPGHGTYAGRLDWQQFEIAAKRYLPFASGVSAKFTLGRDTFSLDELYWRLPHSELDVRAELANFRSNAWNIRYRGKLDLLDINTILRKPHVPGGVVDFSGQADYRDGDWHASGHHAAHQISLPYQWFHDKQIESSGRFEATKDKVMLPEFEARAEGGKLTGRLEMNPHTLAFRVDAKVRGDSLASLLAAVDNPSLPVHTLHWDGIVDVDAVTTWTADFKHFRSVGESRWSPPTTLAPGTIPTTALIHFDYSADRRDAQLTQSQITTPTMRLNIDGALSAVDCTLETRLEADNLLEWDEFINYLRGPDSEPRRISGRTVFQGRVLGPLGGPTFVGHVKTFDAHYEQYAWDEIEGDLNYSPDEFRLDHATVRRGKSNAALDLQLSFDGDWGFLPESPWKLTIKFDQDPLEDIQGLFGTNYPASGLLSGEFTGGGTRALPTLGGDFVLAKVNAWSVQVDEFRGRLGLTGDEVRISNGRISKQAARMSGDFAYRFEDKSVDFKLSGSDISLDQIEKLQSASMPIGGTVSFDLAGKGPWLAPQVNGTLRLAKLRIGGEVQGDLQGKLDSDGRNTRLQLTSKMANGDLQGEFNLGLSGDYPYTGELTVQNVDLDPFIRIGLHLKAVTGHSSVDGHFALKGAVRKPGSLEIQAEISRIKFDYQFVDLQNVDAIRLVYRRDEIRVEQAHIKGSNSDFRFSGFARFAGDHSLDLKLAGSVNLQLITGFVPALEATGAAQIDAGIQGTTSNPQITGRLRVEDASARYGDFPAGLSHVKGDLVFDKTRLYFDQLTAEAGGGLLKMDGSVTYGDGGLRYEINTHANRIRLRYPEGMSWLIGGTLRFNGTTDAGTISGNLVMDRLLLGQGVDLSTLIVSSKDSGHGPATNSPFLSNLQFDILVDSGPDARLQWEGANVSTEGSLRVRGTWDHPIMLGHIHLISGEMSFRGNRYTLSRGDINFSNPFRLDPVLNIEATTTIQQYQITLDFSGPASHLSLAYRSDPPLPSADVIALLALGTTSEESALRSSSAGQSQNFGATALLSEALTSQIGGRIQHLFGISRFRIDPFLSGTSTEQNAAARITIQQQVTRDLMITYSTNTTSDQEQVIEVEYAIRRDISIVALRDNNGTFGLDVKFTKRFK
ncbi:MAG: translocation/assembly module TamB domain-containing protein [Candidatus Acidiferrales bacterium]